MESPISVTQLTKVDELQQLVGERKTPLPEHVLCRFPPHCRAELQGDSSDPESSGPGEPFQIPKSASVEFAVHTVFK